MDKNRREELRDYVDNGESACPTKAEVRALLDMADERDRYQEALKQAKTELWRCRSDMAIMFLDDDGGIPDEDDQRRVADIEQAALACSDALEGKE